jgi:signal transduction histidine kinase
MILLGLVAVVFGAFIYASQTRDIAGENQFRMTREMDDIRRSLALGAPVLIRDNEAYALFDAEGRVIRAQGLTEERALALAAKAVTRAGTPAEGKAGNAAAGTVDGKAGNEAESGAWKDKRRPPLPHHGGEVSWIDGGPEGGMSYAYSRLGGGPDGAPIGGASALLFGSPLDPYGLNRRLLVTILVATAFMLGAAMLSGIWLANRALRPVAQMAQTARSIGEGDLSRRIRLGTRDELGELSEVFDAMFDRLEADFERQKRFVADAGHELRTPLSIISLESERALSSEREATDYRRSLELVLRECGNMKRLVEDLLALARAESGERRRAFCSVDLGVVVLGAMERFAPLAKAAELSLLAGELPEAAVMGDAAALGTMVGNLLDNAIKYSKGPGGSVRIKLETRGAEALIRIEDDGIGIPADKLGRVFDRFYRVDESRSETGGAPAGSGLGLSMVKAIAAAHGGRVEASSEPGRGSAFSVWIPLRRG